MLPASSSQDVNSYAPAVLVSEHSAVATLIWNDLRKSSAASRDLTLVVMTESSTYSPVISCLDVDAQATKVAISIMIIKQRISMLTEEWY